METVKQYNKLLKAFKKAHKNLMDFRKSLVGQCTHPEEFCQTHERDFDNGYGKWGKDTIKTCLCGARWVKYIEKWQEVGPVWPTAHE